MTDPTRCQCGSPKPSIHEFCSLECEVVALRNRVLELESVADDIADNRDFWRRKYESARVSLEE